VISVFIAFIGIYFLFNQKLIKESVQNKAVVRGTEVVSKVQRHVVATKEITSNISEQILFYSYQQHADLFIKSLVEKYSFIKAIHVNIDSSITELKYHNYYCYKQNDSTVTLHGNTRFNTFINEDVNFEKMVKNGIADWSEPIRCDETGSVVVSYYSPIEILVDSETPQKVGEVICELSILELNDAVNGVKIGENGFVFLLSKEGVFITHPRKEWILKRNIFNIAEDVFDVKHFDVAKAQKEGKSGTLVAYPEMLNYEKSWIYYTPIVENGWTLIFVLPYKELYEPLFLPVLQMLFFSVLGILLIYLLVTYISNKQMQPLSSLTQQLKRFSKLAGDTNAISANEVAQVSESLNYMKLWYEKYKITSSQEALKNESQKRDISQAAEIQRSFIKTKFPIFPERKDIDLYATYKPAKGVSGDLYDFFFIDKEHIVLTMGDVSGKGVPAAFFMSIAQTIIKKNANEHSAKSIVTSVNQELYTNNHHQFFLTLFLGVLNIETGMFTYCNAAHTISYILKSNGKLVELAQSHGLPLGLYPDKKYQEATIQLKKGDSVILYTDGVTELNDADKQQYGNQRLEENLKNLAQKNPKEMVLKLERSLELFIGNTKQSDDISILILNYKA
jgi:sigma-B regulation protein RsbU (phosphoserine phosphatase)